MQNVAIYNEKLAAEILIVLNNIFNDVEETTHHNELCEMDWSICEEFLVSVTQYLCRTVIITFHIDEIFDVSTGPPNVI